MLTTGIIHIAYNALPCKGIQKVFEDLAVQQARISRMSLQNSNAWSLDSIPPISLHKHKIQIRTNNSTIFLPISKPPLPQYTLKSRKIELKTTNYIPLKHIRTVPHSKNLPNQPFTPTIPETLPEHITFQIRIDIIKTEFVALKCMKNKTRHVQQKLLSHKKQTLKNNHTLASISSLSITTSFGTSSKESK